MAYLSIICQVVQKTINMEPIEASKFSDGFYKSTDWTKKRFLKRSLYLPLPRIKEEGRLDFWQAAHIFRVKSFVILGLDSQAHFLKVLIFMFPCFSCSRKLVETCSETGLWWMIFLPVSVGRELETQIYQQVGWQLPTALSNTGEMKTRLRRAIPEHNLFHCRHHCLLTFLPHPGLFGATALLGCSSDLVLFSCHDTSACLRVWAPVILPLMGFVPLIGHHVSHSLVETLKIRKLELTFSTPSSNCVQRKWHKKAQQFLLSSLMVTYNPSHHRLPFPWKILIR